MQAVSRETEAGTVSGECESGFEPVLEAFVENFASRGELGASVAIRHEGRTVVDLWGGKATRDGDAAWERDTVSIVFSCTKAATALCAHILADRGQLDLDAPVSEIWPEFATNGKERATTRMMLDHTVGLPAMREQLKPDCLVDWTYMTEKLAAEEPFWEPGSRLGYHALTYGFTVGEMVRRVSGKSLGTFFRDEVAGPLGLDYWIGLPEEIEPRVAPMVVFRPGPDDAVTPFMQVAKQRGTIANLFMFNHGDWAGKRMNTREGRAAEIGAAGGVTNGRGLARFYEPLANGGTSVDGVRVIGADAIPGMAECSAATHLDATLQVATRFSAGYMLSMDNRASGGDSVLLGRRAFGHVGAGGSIGFADPECSLAFGYTMNRMGAGLFLNPRGQSLVDAAYRCLGYRTSEKGWWVN